MTKNVDYFCPIRRQPLDRPEVGRPSMTGPGEFWRAEVKKKHDSRGWSCSFLRSPVVYAGSTGGARRVAARVKNAISGLVPVRDCLCAVGKKLAPKFLSHLQYRPIPDPLRKERDHGLCSVFLGRNWRQRSLLGTEESVQETQESGGGGWTLQACASLTSS